MNGWLAISKSSNSLAAGDSLRIPFLGRFGFISALSARYHSRWSRIEVRLVFLPLSFFPLFIFYTFISSCTLRCYPGEPPQELACYAADSLSRTDAPLVEFAAIRLLWATCGLFLLASCCHCHGRWFSSFRGHCSHRGYRRARRWRERWWRGERSWSSSSFARYCYCRRFSSSTWPDGHRTCITWSQRRSHQDRSPTVPSDVCLFVIAAHRFYVSVKPCLYRLSIQGGPVRLMSPKQCVRRLFAQGGLRRGVVNDFARSTPVLPSSSFQFTQSYDTAARRHRCPSRECLFIHWRDKMMTTAIARVSKLFSSISPIRGAEFVENVSSRRIKYLESNHGIRLCVFPLRRTKKIPEIARWADSVLSTPSNFFLSFFLSFFFLKFLRIEGSVGFWLALELLFIHFFHHFDSSAFARTSHFTLWSMTRVLSLFLSMKTSRFTLYGSYMQITRVRIACPLAEPLSIKKEEEEKNKIHIQIIGFFLVFFLF